ncbi:hypothetical protein ACFS7Z_20375 [Pontibacter toksunensis]|uniref:Outer membrane protein beta-barrel domain-containing protein n=1 Tax=Pontibacter toksunensis TaxID=1332631 RepID=A0ABW6C0F9_9BACT
MPIKVAILLLLFSFLSQEARPQENMGKEVQQESGEFNLSMTLGIGLFGPKEDIEDQMKASGFGDTRGPGWFSDEATQYPKAYNILIANIGATYYFKRTRGVSLVVGLTDNVQVDGYDEIGIGNRLHLKSEIWVASLNYVFRSSDKKHQLNIGPALFLHRVRDNAERPTSQKNNNVKPGLYAGYTLHVIHKEDWYLALNLNGRWATESAIGPFIIVHETGILLPEPEVQRSEFQPTKVQLTGLSLGLALGFRMGNGRS